MKIAVEWHKRQSPHEFEFEGLTSHGLKTQIGARSVPDGPQSAPSPKEFVAFGMASCTAIDVVSTLQKMRQPLSDFSVTCDIEQTEEHPRVFKMCLMTYHVKGENLESGRVSHAVSLSLYKYCGVSAMIEASGCHITAKLIVNGSEIPIEKRTEHSKSNL